MHKCLYFIFSSYRIYNFSQIKYRIYKLKAKRPMPMPRATPTTHPPPLTQLLLIKLKGVNDSE